MKVLVFALWLYGIGSGLAQLAPGRRALVIGNSAYRSIPVLAQSRGNAETMDAALREIHFRTMLHLDLDQAGLVKAIGTFEDSLQPGDIVFVYYSGFALQGEDGNWLLPVGFDPKSDLKISRIAYSLSTLLEDLASKPGPRLVVIDAATDAPELSRWTTGEGLANSNVDPQTLLCFSTWPGTGAKIRPGSGPGPFVKNLAAALKTPGLEPVKVFDKVQGQLRLETAGAQSPFYVPFAVNPFFFVNPPLKLPDGPPPPAVLKAGAKRENAIDGLDYVWIPAGNFKMGCVPADKFCAEDEKPQHEVAITKGFWISRTEVTVGAYLRFTTTQKLPQPKPTQTNPGWKYTAHPISKVSWPDADAYCKWTGGSLPTEAQWEYAARGGISDQIYPWGDKYDPSFANTYDTKGPDKRKFPETLPVKYFLDHPNKFDLFDVSGNVREWTLDTYNPRAYQRGSGVRDPVEAGDGKEKVARGGSFNGGMKDLRLSERDHLDPLKEVTNQTGFRCVLPELL